MASNYTQHLQALAEDELPLLGDDLTVIQGSNESQTVAQCSHNLLENLVAQSDQPHVEDVISVKKKKKKKIAFDPLILRNRRIGLSHDGLRDIEFLGEDKIAKHKLEEVHWSLPSSAKPTFMMIFSPDGQKVASTHGDHRIYICDLNTGKLLDTLEGHPKTPWCFAWHPTNNDIIASGCLAGEVRVWNLRTKAYESWSSENNSIITSIGFHPKENFLVIGTSNNIYFWDWSEPVPFAMITTPNDRERVKYVDFDSSGTKLITGITNFSKVPSYGNDSLQNRIIDSYLTQGSLEHLPTDNMTQNSEITNQLEGPPAPNDIFSERVAALRLPSQRQQISEINGEDPVTNGLTLTLFRIACLYRNLEALEDSMRHTTFSPFNNPNPPSNNLVNDELSRSESDPQNVTAATPSNAETSTPNTHRSEVINETTKIKQLNRNNISAENNQPRSNEPQVTRSMQAPNAYEPLVVLFDELLENIQLNPITYRGRTIDLSSILERNSDPNVPNNLNFMMRFESINQVNQNFIRISKLMSSVRLYRQIIQQILSSGSGRGHYQPNQILTAQSSSLGASRSPSQLPMMFRNLSTTLGQNNLRTNHSIDPILAIQFRNSARNVPLAAICKVDLLSARSLCMMRSQHYLECCASSQGPESNNGSVSNEILEVLNELLEPSNRTLSSSIDEDTDTTRVIEPFYMLLSHLQRALSTINHAPLSTSNVHAHIASLRKLLDRILTRFYSMLQTRDEGRRLVNLVHEISRSLTGRSWTSPLGATLDDLRLDVIHTFSMIDLALHLARQIQLLQMQRISAIARARECIRNSRRSESVTLGQCSTSDRSTSNLQQQGSSQIKPTSSRDLSSDRPGKRKNPGPSLSNDVSSKKAKVETNINLEQFRDQIIDENTTQPSIANEQTSSENFGQPTRPNTTTNSDLVNTNEAPSVVDTNSEANPSTIEPGVQRLLLASAPGNLYLLMRVFHRIQNQGPAIIPQIVNEQPPERLNPPYEVRRRALSQDNSASADVQNSNNPDVESVRGRGLYFNHPPVGNGVGPIFDLWTRQHHLHIWIPHQARGNVFWMAPSPSANTSYRLQCWEFTLSSIPDIKDPQSNIIASRCRIDNNSSVDISRDGTLIACFVPREENQQSIVTNYELRIISLKSKDFGTCYHSLQLTPQTFSVSLSPSARYVVVGQSTVRQITNVSDQVDDLTIAKVYSLNEKQRYDHVRDIKIKRDSPLPNLNAIRWMPRGIVYSVGQGPLYHHHYHQRHQARRFNHHI